MSQPAAHLDEAMRRPVAEALARRQLDGVRVNGILTVGPPEAEPDAPCDAYRVYLVTGDLRGAGSACGVRVKLSGAVRESGWVQLTDVHDHPLERASIEEFDVDVRQTGGKGGGERRGDIGECAVDERAAGGEGEGDALDDGRGPVPTHGLGELLGFEVFFDKGGEEQRVDGWFLDRAEVTHRRSGERWVFPCARWFGEAAGPDSPARVFQRLVPRSGDAMGHGVAHGRDVPGHARAARPLRVRPADAPKLRLHCGAAAVPHPKKVQQGIRGAVLREEGYAGEDAYFVLRGGQHAIGVADGVYLWRDHGIDAGEFARSLMSAAKSAAAALGDPVDVLRVARQAVRDMPGVKGSCTACVLTLDCNAGVIRSANIGDSGFAVFRPSGRVAFHTPQQEYNFGCPYQLGHHEGANEADDAQVATVAVDSGDIIVAGSDGLWDNLFDTEISELLQPLRQIDVEDPNIRSAHMEQASAAVARAIVAASLEASTDRRRVTPYSRGASEEFDMCYSGGKRDDIAVVVARVSSASEFADSLCG